MNKAIIGGIIAVIIVIVLAVAVFVPSEDNVFYDSMGTVSAKSSDLTFSYNNDESIYGSFTPEGEFDHVMYYDESKIAGKVKIDLDKVKWDKKYEPDNSTDDNENVVVHVNNISYAKNNFTDELMKDYKNGNVSIESSIYLQDKKGRDYYSHPDDYNIYLGNDKSKGVVIKDLKLKDDVVTLKIKHDYHSDINTTISNDVDYQGNLLDSKNNDDKISKALIILRFYNDKYDFTVECPLKGDDFTSVHM